MAQQMPRPTSVHITEPESQDDLKVEIIGDLPTFMSGALGNDVSVNRMLGDADFRSEVIDGLRTRAHGNIYCASVLLRQMKDQLHMTGIRETPRMTPEDIDDEIVQNILYNINLQDEGQAKLARRILALLTAAKGPMTAEAMCHALGMSYVLETEPLPRELEKDLIPDVGVLIKCCGDLISIDPVTRLVTLAQDDIAECMRRQRSAYLSRNISSTRTIMDHFSYEEMKVLAAVSLAYLSMRIFEEGPCHQVAALRKRLEEYPFLEYAARHWGYHVRKLLSRPVSYEIIKDNARILLRKAKNLESVLQARDLDADVVGLRKILQKGKEHDQVLGATQIRTDVSALQVLSAYGLTHMVQDLLVSKPATSFKPDSFGTSAIHEAAQARWDDIMKILMKAGVDPFAMDRNGKSPLYYAARNGYDRVVSVLQVDKQVQVKPHELALALVEVIEAGETDLVVRLLKYQNTRSERSTILISIRAGYLDILELLLARGAELVYPDFCPDIPPSNQIPLHQAIKHGRADMAKLLLDHGANIHTWDDKKRNAVFETLKAPNTDGLSLLLDRGISINGCDSEGNTVLHQAAVDGPVEHARLLIEQGMISKTTFNEEGLLPLHLAVRAQQFEIVDILLESEKVDVNITGRGRAAGWTPLMYAVVAGSLKLCDTLIQKGAHVNVSGSIDVSILCKLAVDAGHYAIYEMLLAERIRPRHQ